MFHVVDPPAWQLARQCELPSRMSEREKGAFVYKGAGRRSKMAEDAAPEQRLCDTFHVQMQRCLAARNHQEKRVHALRTSNHARTPAERPCHHSRRWCQEDIKAWRKCFEEQRALDGRPVDSSDSPLQKARQKLDPAKYDKQGRPLK